MEETPDPGETKTDVALSVAVSVGKAAAAAAVPYLVVGAIVGDIVGTLIPNLRANRIAEYLHFLHERLESLDATVRDEKMRSEEFIDLIEDSMWQAARSLTSERRKQIAAVLAYGLYHGELTHI